MNERNLKCAVYHTALEAQISPIDTMDKWTALCAKLLSSSIAVAWLPPGRSTNLDGDLCDRERPAARLVSRHRDLISHSLCRMRPLIVARVRTTRMASSGRSALPIVSRLRWKSASFGTFSHGTTESGATHIGQQQYIPLDPLSAFSCNLKC